MYGVNDAKVYAYSKDNDFSTICIVDGQYENGEWVHYGGLNTHLKFNNCNLYACMGEDDNSKYNKQRIIDFRSKCSNSSATFDTCTFTSIIGKVKRDESGKFVGFEDTAIKKSLDLSDSEVYEEYIYNQAGENVTITIK